MIGQVQQAARVRTIAAFAAALTAAAGTYAFIDAMRPDDGFVGIAFLFVLPAALSAFVARVVDPAGARRLGSYMLVPVYLFMAIVAVSVIALREGVVCILMLAPVWLLLGCAGAGLAFRLRPRGLTDTAALSDVFRSSAWLLLLPAILVQVETAIPSPERTVTVVREITVDAPASRVWPLLRGIPALRPDEGRWTVSQNLIGIARPIGATLAGEGVGAVRRVRWQSAIDFEERVVEWQAERVIRWTFVFDRASMARFGDRHLLPDGPYMKIMDGGYRIEPIDGGRTRVRLDTRYWMRTPVNGYAALWGELFLGDLETNVLAIIKDRAEAR